MVWVRAIAGVLMLWCSAAWATTLSWNSNNESDLAGYHVYRCTQLPCTRTSGTASSLATLGTATSFDIGTPAVTQHYFITAYDFANNESAGSGLATFTPVGSTPPVAPPAISAARPVSPLRPRRVAPIQPLSRSASTTWAVAQQAGASVMTPPGWGTLRTRTQVPAP